MLTGREILAAHATQRHDGKVVEVSLFYRDPSRADRERQFTKHAVSMMFTVCLHTFLRPSIPRRALNYAAIVLLSLILRLASPTPPTQPLRSEHR